MIEKREQLGQLNDYFLNLSQRPGKGIYFYRIFLLEYRDFKIPAAISGCGEAVRSCDSGKNTKSG